MAYRSLLVVALAALVALSAAPPGPRAADAGTVIVSQGVDVDTLSPIRTTVTPTFNVVGNMYDYLVDFTPDGKPVPNLALSWKRVGPLSVEYKLRPNVKFHNGDAFTSADVKFTVEKVKDPAYKSTQTTYVSEIASIETPDPLTVRVNVKRASALLPFQRQRVYIVDSKFWRDHGDAYMETHEMGTGPFVLAHWNKDEEVAMDANPTYWAGAPKLKHLIYRPSPDASARVAALKTGASDLITNVPPQYAIQIAGGRSTKMESTRSNRQLFIAFNTLKDGPQKNKLVRQALNYAVDVPSIIKNVLGGRGYELTSPIPYGFFAFDPKSRLYSYDPAKAKALLAQAGYADPAKLEITLNAPSGRYNRDAEVAQAVGGYIGQLGVKVTVRTSEWTNYSNQVNTRSLTPLYELGWGGLPNFDPDGIFTPLFSSEGAIATWSEPETDKLFSDGRYEFDPAKRRALYAKAAAIVKEEAPWIFLFQYEDLYGTSKRLQWHPRADEAIYGKEMTLRE